ncbi:MAG: hypothetical protein HOP33_01465 [Verrucomicrobia bacterium]|nr:hypothetical protein [Verrucomicrobiota bacterium]
MPKSMGCVYWQYNDIWPGMNWSSVDYFGRWKALHYMARTFYSPLLVSGLENIKDGTIDLFVTSDELELHRGKLSWNVTDLAGRTLRHDSMSVPLPARKSEKVKTLDLQTEVKNQGANGLLTWLKLEVDGKTVSENLVLLALPKELKLSDPKLASSVKELGDGFLVTIQSATPALWVWLGLKNADAKYADNFIHLMPDVPQTVLVQPKEPISREVFLGELQVRSLFDTYSPA